jgi:hypothetical protein
MTEEPDNLVLEMLRAIRADIGQIGDRMQRIELRFGALETRFGALESRFGIMEERMAGVETRLDRIDKRLGLQEL